MRKVFPLTTAELWKAKHVGCILGPGFSAYISGFILEDECFNARVAIFGKQMNGQKHKPCLAGGDPSKPLYLPVKFLSLPAGTPTDWTAGQLFARGGWLEIPPFPPEIPESLKLPWPATAP